MTKKQIKRHFDFLRELDRETGKMSKTKSNEKDINIDRIIENLIV